MEDRLKGVEGTEAGLDAQPNVRAKLYTDEVLVGFVRLKPVESRLLIQLRHPSAQSDSQRNYGRKNNQTEVNRWYVTTSFRPVD